jgi:hypothetical protein
VTQTWKNRTGEHFFDKWEVAFSSPGDSWSAAFTGKVRKTFINNFSGVTDAEFEVRDPIRAGRKDVYRMNPGQQTDFGSQHSVKLTCVNMGPTGGGGFYLHVEWHRDDGIDINL